MDRLQIIKDKLELYNQGHLLSFYDDLNFDQRLFM